MSKISTIIYNTVVNGRKEIHLKFSNEAAYNEAINKLIVEAKFGNIVAYAYKTQQISGEIKYSYMKADLQNCITFIIN